MNYHLGLIAQDARAGLELKKILSVHLVFRSDQESSAVLFAELGLLNLAGGISGNFGEDDLAGPLVAGKLAAVIIDLLFCAGKSFLELNDRSSNLAQTLVGQADDSDVIDGLKGVQEVFDLNRVDILTAGDDDILLAVYKVVETVLVLHGHVAGVEPAVIVQNFLGSSGIVVVADHDAGALDSKFADFTLLDGIAVFVHNAALPLVTGDADCTDFVDIFHTEVYAAGSEGLGEAVVGCHTDDAGSNPASA